MTIAAGQQALAADILVEHNADGTHQSAAVTEAGVIAALGLTTKGDIPVAASGSDVQRLAVGATADMVLTVDSAQTLGVKWALPYSTLLTGTTGAILLPGILPASGNLAVGSANEVRVYKFHVSQAIVIASVHFVLSTGNAGTFCSMGVYSADGNTLEISTGAIATDSTGLKSTTLGAAVTLLPGMFWLAWTANHTTPTCRGTTAWNSTDDADINAGTVFMGAAANASSAGVLPAALGTVTSAFFIQARCKLQG